jgi:glycosyltransferase involved in cell wall biosynthesis
VSRSNPTFSIITAVYNGENFIRETVDSVLSSSAHQDCEYIVINDGSTDKTLEILQTYGNHIRVITQVNSGESAAINVGIDLSLGKFLLVVSADDPLFSAEIFEGIVDEFKNNDALVAIYPDWQIIDSNSRVLEVKKLPDFSSKEFLGKNIVLPGPGTIFRRDAALKLLGRNEKLKFVGDYDFWLRLSDLGEIKHRPQTLAQWRSHGGSTSISRRSTAMAIERIEVIEEYLDKTNVKYPNKIKRMALGNAYSLAARLIFFDNLGPGKKFLWKAFCKRRWWPERLSVLQAGFIILYPISRIGFRMVRRLFS